MSTDAVDPLSLVLTKATQLNEATLLANKHLATVEKQLADANIGITFWFDSRPLLESDSTGDLGPTATSVYTAEVLGFGRVEGKWCLAVKPLRFVNGFFEGQTDQPFTNVYSDGEPVHLLKTSRETRLAALRILDEFLTAFAERIGEKVGDVEVETGKLVR